MTIKNYNKDEPPKKPAFDPNKPYEPIKENKPVFDPNQPFEAVDVKKKDGGTASDSGGLSTLMKAHGDKYKPSTTLPSLPAPSKEDLGVDDPIKHNLAPLRERAAKNIDNLIKIGSSNRDVSESSKQINILGDRRGIDADADFQRNLKKDAELSGLFLQEKKNELVNKVLPNGKKALEYVKDEYVKHNGELPEDNETINIAIQKANRYQDLKEKIEGIGNLRTAAVEIMRENDPHMDKTISELENAKIGGKATGEGAYIYENVIPGAMQGRMVDMVLHDPDVELIVQDNPRLKEQFDKLRSGGIYQAYPEYGEIEVRNRLSREYEKRRANLIANPIFNKSKYLDNLADELFANDPALKAIADQMKGNWEGKIDTKGIIDNIGSGARETFEGMSGSLKDVVGLGDSETDRLFKGLEQTYSPVSSGVKGWQKDIGTAAHFGGMIAAMGVGGAPGRALKLNAAAINTIVTAATFYDSELNNWTMKYPGEPLKAQTGAVLSTAAFAAVSKIFPSAKVADAIVGKLQPSIAESLSKLSEGEISNEMKRNLVKDFGKILAKTAGGSAESAAHMVAITTFQDALERGMGGEGKEDEEYIDVARNMLIGSAFPQFMKSYGNKDAVGKSLLSIATFPKRYKSVLENMKMDDSAITKQIQEKLTDIDFLNATKIKLDEAGVSEKNQERYLVEAMNEKYSTKKVETEPTIDKKEKDKIKESQEIKERILDGEDADTIVTTAEQKVIDENKKKQEEQEKVVLELESLTKEKELHNKEFDLKIKDLDGRNPEEKIKKDKLELQRETKNKEYDSKIQKLSEQKEASIPVEETVTRGPEMEGLLDELKSKAGEFEKKENLQYFIDKAAEAPAQYYEKYGKESTDKLLEYTLTKKLKQNLDDLLEISPDNPNVPILDKLIADREKKENGEPSKQTPKEQSLTEQKAHSENIKTKFREQFKSKGIPDDQITGAIALMDARAKSWASEERGRTPEQWFDQIADVKAGEFENKSNVAYQLLEPSDFTKDNNGNIVGVKEQIIKEINEERSRIESDAKENDTYLKAPNGKSTKLSPDDWTTVRTSRFKKWFGDWETNPKNSSKIVDSNGEPLVMYHGSDSGHTTFDRKKIDKINTGAAKGFHFTSSKESAKRYGKNIYSAYLNVRNPRRGFSESQMHTTVITKNMDGWTNRFDIGETGSAADVVVYEPNQIKSTENEGTYSENNSIKYQGEWKKAIVAAALALQPLKTDIKLNTGKINTSKNIEKSISTPKEKVQIEKFVKDYYARNKEEAPQEVIDRAIEVWEKFGKPVIMPDSTGKNERAFANQGIREGKLVIDTISQITNFDDFIAEMSHAAQYQSGEPLSVGVYKTQAERDKYEYQRKGSIEYDAHKLIEPLLTNFVLFGKRGDDLTISTLNSMAPSLSDQIIPAAEKYKIKFQNNKGAVETLKDGRVVIHALDSPDFSTMVHEIAHVFEGDLTAAEQKTVKDFGGSEAFARGFERYLRNGISPNKEMIPLFQKFRNWLMDIYKSFVGTPIEKRISPEIKKIFDRLLTEQSNELATMEASQPKTNTSVELKEMPLVDKKMITKAFEVFNNGERVGSISLKDMGDYYSIKGAKIETPGKGIGTEAYRQIIASSDKPIHSDPNGSSNSATAVWKKLEKEGLVIYDEKTKTYKSEIENIVRSKKEQPKPNETKAISSTYKGRPPIHTTEPPAEPPKGTEEGGEASGITHAANEIRRQDRLLPEYDKSPQTFEQWNNEAEKKIKKGYDVEKLMDKIEKGHAPDPVENALRKIYIVTLDAEIAKNPTDTLLAKQKRFIEIGDLANSRAGRNLVSLKGEGSPLSTISDFYVAKMEAAGVDKLTEKQKEDTKKAFDDVQKADSNATAAMEAYKEEIAKLKAENELLKEKKTVASKKQKSDWKQQRQDAIEGAREALKKLRTGESGLSAVPLPGVRELIAIAPHVKKYVGALLGEGVHNLKEVVTKAYDEFKDILEGITEKDIHNIIAGEYNEKRPTRNELAAKMRDLKDEAYYINKLERLLKGEQPKNEKGKVNRNQQITELQQKIKEFQKAERDAAKEPKEEVDVDLKKLESIKKRNEKQTLEIKERIAKGDFEIKKEIPFLEDPEMQKKFPKQYNETLDAIKKKEDARHDFDIALLRDEMSRRTLAEKATDNLNKAAGTVKAITTGIDDSAVAIQTYVSMLIRPRTGARAFYEHIRQGASQKKFDRWLTALHSSADFKEMKDMGLDVTEPQSLKEREKEEIFNNRFNGTVKIKGKEYKLIDAPLKPFERAFTTLGNVTRVVGYRTISAKYKREGYTPEKNPELFKSLATRLNTETGRGAVNEYVDKANKVITMGIWSPKLMATKFNLLGVSDLASLILSKAGTKGYYRQLHPKERIAAIKDVAQFATTVMALSYGLALAFGGDIDTDPLSSTFMDVKFQNGKSYNLTGGFSGYIRAIAQFIAGKKSIGTGTKDVNRLETAGRFFRGKTPPLTSAVLNLASGKNYMGEPTTPIGELINLAPISLRGIGQQIQNDGATSFFTQGIPTFFGFNVKNEKDYQKNDELSEEEKKDPVLKTFLDKGVSFPNYDPKKIQTKEVNGKITEHLSDYSKEIQDKYIKLHKEYYKEELRKLKDGEYEVYRDGSGSVHIESDKTDITDMEYVPFNKLSDDEIKYLEGILTGNATKLAKKEIFEKE